MMRFMKLLTYMADRDLDDSALAEKIGNCSEYAVRKWKYGERIPRLAHLIRIAEVTEGAVTANDFVPLVDRPEGDAS